MHYINYPMQGCNPFCRQIYKHPYDPLLATEFFIHLMHMTIIHISNSKFLISQCYQQKETQNWNIANVEENTKQVVEIVMTQNIPYWPAIDTSKNLR